MFVRDIKMSEKRKPTITKIHITSNNICLGPCPEPEDEVEQVLSIERNGQVEISRYAYGFADNKLIEEERFSVDEDKAEAIFDAIGRCFYEGDDAYMVTDVGRWEMTVFDDAGNADRFMGALIESDYTQVDGESISDIIRMNLGRKDLFVFDGNPDKIDRVEVIYNRVTKIVPGKKMNDASPDCLIWDYKETLSIDRQTETLEVRNRIGEGCEVTHTYYVQGGIETFLDTMCPDMLNDIEGNPPDVVTDPMETRTYEMKIISKRGIETSVSGTYDKKGLPSAWAEFMEDLQDFIAFYGFPGEMFSERCFGKVLRREGERIFCDVIFEEGGKSYCYIADSEDFYVGDLVVVPAGAFNRRAVGRIEGIHYLTEENAPFPSDKAKHIIGAYDPDEDI